MGREYPQRRRDENHPKRALGRDSHLWWAASKRRPDASRLHQPWADSARSLVRHSSPAEHGRYHGWLPGVRVFRGGRQVKILAETIGFGHPLPSKERSLRPSPS